MARLLMGAIVTKAVGKIGGQCFRIKNQTQILQRNPNPFKNRAINQNSAMGVIRKVFTSWSRISSTERDLWTTIASVNPQPDRFGNMVTLSGRDYFNQANINVGLVGMSNIDPRSYINTVPYLYFSSIDLNLAEGVIDLVDLELTIDGQMAIYIREVTNQANNPIASSLKLIAYMQASIYDGATMYFLCNAAGFHFYPNRWYSIACRVISASGVTSPYIQFTVQGHT
jgi:hypothetical protein